MASLTEEEIEVSTGSVWGPVNALGPLLFQSQDEVGLQQVNNEAVLQMAFTGV